MASSKAIRKAIRNSDLTLEDLDQIAHTLGLKRRGVESAFARSLEVGDRIVLFNVRPKYMAGHEGIVVKRVSAAKIEVDLDQAPNSKRYGKKLVVPASAVRRIEDDGVPQMAPPSGRIYERG